jgi:hypothetical protein
MFAGCQQNYTEHQPLRGFAVFLIAIEGIEICRKSSAHGAFKGDQMCSLWSTGQLKEQDLLWTIR